ncbi:MAG: hypothetical protein ABWZ80_08165 [Beijerinckiaceae bacterium]
MSGKPVRIARLFLVTSVLLGLSGMMLGMGMGIAEDFRLKGVHVHIDLIGFVTMFLAGLFYRIFPAAAGKLAYAQYGAVTVGLAFMAPGIAGIYLGVPAIAWMTKPGSVLVLASMIMFVWNVVSATFNDCDADIASSGSPGSKGFKAMDERVLAARAEAARIVAEAARDLAPQPA